MDRTRKAGLHQRRLGQNIRRFRRDADLTQIELASEVGMSQPTLSDLERGARDVRTEQLAQIARALGVSLQDLVD